MSKSQKHGKEFEIAVMRGLNIPDNEIEMINHQNKWDIPKKFSTDGISCDIKTAKNGGPVCMADARRFMKIRYEFKLIVGLYSQEGNRKKFFKIIEYIISQDVFEKHIKVDLSYDDVENFHNGISMNKIRDYKEARKFAKDTNETMKKKNTIIKLNPKIDSKTQRRLQCSLSLDDIDSIKEITKTEYNDKFCNLTLPFYVESSKREFRK